MLLSVRQSQAEVAMANRRCYFAGHWVTERRNKYVVKHPSLTTKECSAHQWSQNSLPDQKDAHLHHGEKLQGLSSWRHTPCGVQICCSNPARPPQAMAPPAASGCASRPRGSRGRPPRIRRCSRSWAHGLVECAARRIPHLPARHSPCRTLATGFPYRGGTCKVKSLSSLR